MNQNINKIQQLLNKNTTESDLTHLILVWIRKELESSKESGQLDTLKFFCDWALHTKIEWSPIGSTLVVNLHKTIDKYKAGNTNQLIQEVKETLITNFKNQLKTFLNDKKLQTNIVNNEQEWEIFLSSLFEILIQIPVNLKLAHETELKATALKTGMWVNKISVIKSNLEGAIDHEIYCLEISTSDTTTIIIPLI